MRLIVSGDIHIKVSSELPLEWQMDRFRMLWNNYVSLCQQHQAGLVLAGDIFDNAKPNLYEVQLFLELLHLLEENEIDTDLIAGNHENLGSRGTTLDYFHATFKGLTWVRHHSDYTVNGDLVFVGHNQLQAWMDSDEAKKWDGTRIIFSHFRPTVNQWVQEEIDVDRFLATGTYAFLSDIHTDFQLSDKAVYTNSPMNTHFEATPKCGCLLVTVDGSNVTWKRIPLKLPNLIQVDCTAEDFEEKQDSFNFYRYTITGTTEELRKLKSTQPNCKLLKIPEVIETYTELEVKEEVKDQSLEDALVDYMQGLEFSESKIQDMVEVYREL